jgi:hypothetical protein
MGLSEIFKSRAEKDAEARKKETESRIKEYGAARDLANVYMNGKSTFAGSDVRTLFYVPTTVEGQPVAIEMKNIQTISYSIFREKIAVRALGFIGEKGKARGTRTVAGSIVFTTFDQHPLLQVMRKNPGDMSYLEINSNGLNQLEYLLPDQLPPLNVVMQFANEVGRQAEIVLFGLEFMTEGQVMSIHDMVTENTMQFTAQHIAVMRPGQFESAYSQGDPADAAGPAVNNRSFSSIMNNKNRTPELNEFIYRSSNPFR